MKILVVDDHVLIRDAVRGVLKELKNDADVLEASDCRQAMAEDAPYVHLSRKTNLLIDFVQSYGDAGKAEP